MAGPDPKEKALIINAIKRVFSRSNVRKGVLLAAIAKKKGPRGGRLFKCRSCKKAVPLREVQVDHRDPVVPIGMAGKDMSFDEIVSRIYCEPANLQVLCKTCHKKKSKQEASERSKLRRKSS